MINNILNIFLMMIAAERTQEVFYFQYMATSVVMIFSVLNPEHWLLIISAVGMDKWGKRLGILLPFHLTPESKFLDISGSGKDAYQKLLRLFSPEKAKKTDEQVKKTEFRPFSPSVFFNDMAPDELSKTEFKGRIIDEIHKENRDQIEDSLRTEFHRIQPHQNDGKNVTPENLMKTEIYLGKEAAEACAICNISTVWYLPTNQDHEDRRNGFWKQLENHKKKTKR